MTLLTGLARVGRGLPIDLRLKRRVAQAGFAIDAWLRYGRMRRRGAPRPGPICVAGFHSSVFGIGEGARAFSAALRAAGVEVIDWDITGLFGHERLFGGDYVSDPPETAGALVIHLNPHELVRLVGMLGPAPFKDRFCVGYWAWELREVPQSWQGAFRYVDEVWTPSHFVADAVAARAPAGLPVRVAPHPLPRSAAAPDRGAFGLPQDAVVVLAAFDAHSGFERKNPIAAVRAFRQATAGLDVPAVMICKTGGREVAEEQFAALEAEVGPGADVRLIDRVLTPQEMGALTASADIVLSMHRSEGFGILMARGMLAGKAVVATGWSGNLEFMGRNISALVDYALVPVRDPQGFYAEGRWAEPDVDDAAAKLRTLIADPAARQALAARGAAAAARRLDPVTLGRIARDWLGLPVQA